jgi:hypothetical protein
MATLVMGYDLNKPGQGYEALQEAVNSFNGTHWRMLQPTCIVQVDPSPRSGSRSPQGSYGRDQQALRHRCLARRRGMEGHGE